LVTKLRNISTNNATKIITFILTVIFITAIAVEFQSVSYKDVIPESLLIKEYKDSESFLSNEVRYAMYETTSILENDEQQPQNVEYYYYISDGVKTYSNSKNMDKSFFTKNNNTFFAYENGSWILDENINPNRISTYYIDNKYTVYISYPNEFMKEKQQEWEASREILIPFAISILILVLLTILSIIFLICVTGRKPNDDNLYLTGIDKFYSDILFACFIPFGTLWIIGVSSLYNPGGYYLSQKLSIIWIGILTAFVSIMCGVILLSLARKAKAGKLFKHTLIFSVFYTIHDFFKSIFDGRMFEKNSLTKSLFYRQLIFIVSSAFLVFLTFVFLFAPPLFLLPPIIEIVMIYWYIKGNNKTFEDINKGFNESLGEQMRAERMKIALVTNVSHDLKTPLTSIISYVDLLSKEENLSETVHDYINILSEKSYRLKNIVSDLFDLAKSTSGDIPLELESLDIKKLIQQTLAVMEDEIEKSGLQIKTKLPENPVNIFSDGKKLYRVFQNIIDNALKYSLEGTRVYVELEEVNGKAIATIKNTAGYEMDFSAEEILQRFSRGDKSRTTEGSGLGLSIAESFTSVCGGKLKVEVDGDLFKVTITFNLDK